MAVAQAFTGREGKYVQIENTVRGFSEILEGKYDDKNEQDFYMIGGMRSSKEMNFALDIVSLTGKIYSGEASKLTLPTREGEITVLARHMPLVAPLTVGEIVVKTPDKEFDLAIGKGIFSMDNNTATLLIEDVTAADDISEEKAIEAKDKAEKLLAQGIKGEERLQVLYALRRSLVDLKVVRRRKKIL
jgi:F-type H+-transporting ATPase subunit epsilon